MAQQLMPHYIRPKIQTNKNNLEIEKTIENNINYRKRKSFNYYINKNENKNENKNKENREMFHQLQ